MNTPSTQANPTAVPHGQWQQAAVVRVVGATAADFLQGYVTCDTARLAPAQAIPMAICNLKGRVVASGWLIHAPDGIDLLIHTTLADRVRTFLKPYVTFSKCRLADDDGQNILVNNADDGIQLLPGLTVQVALTAQVLSDCSAAINTFLIEQEFAFISQAVSEQFLPQVLALHDRGAVDFDKGCYLGQEIVARTQFRGAVKRHLVRFNDAESLAPGDAWGKSGTVIAINEAGQGLASVKASSP